MAGRHQYHHISSRLVSQSLAYSLNSHSPCHSYHLLVLPPSLCCQGFAVLTSSSYRRTSTAYSLVFHSKPHPHLNAQPRSLACEGFKYLIPWQAGLFVFSAATTCVSLQPSTLEEPGTLQVHPLPCTHLVENITCFSCPVSLQILQQFLLTESYSISTWSTFTC